MAGDISYNVCLQQRKRFVNSKTSISKATKRSTKAEKPYSEDKNGSSEETALPLPKGSSPYALAKKAEYKERNLSKAEYLYKKAIKHGDRTKSAVKDLASLMHQRGKTNEACELLNSYKHLFSKDLTKFNNLYSTLQKHANSANAMHKSLKVSGLSAADDRETVLALFENPVRIKQVELQKEENSKQAFYAVLHFNSHSSARKTLEGYSSWDTHKVEWLNEAGVVVGDAHYARHKMEEYRKAHPPYEYVIFERDPNGYVLSMPVDGLGVSVKHPDLEADDVKKLLGGSLYDILCQ